MTLASRTIPITGGPLPYLYALPTRRDGPAPLVVFLHGARDRGTDLDLLLRWAPLTQINARDDLPFHFVAPQIPEGATWVDNSAALLQLIASLTSRPEVDADRVIVAGFSLGAAGAWHVAAENPQVFAGLVAVSGRVPEQLDLHALGNTSIWVFHGEADDKLPAAPVRSVVHALRAKGVSTRFTLFPGADHFIGDLAFGDPGLESWLLSRRREAVQRAAA